MSDAARLGMAVQDCRSCPLGAAASGRCPFTPAHLGAGSLLCAQGERQDYTWFVREGLLALRAVDARGEESWLALRGPRALLHAGVAGSPSPCELRTVTDSRLCGAPARELGEWMGPPGSTSRALLELLLGELQRHWRELDWRSGESSARLARFLLAMCAEDKATRLPPKRLVARALGIRPETLSRCLRRLIEQNLVAEEPGLRVLQRERLAQVASGAAPG